MIPVVGWGGGDNIEAIPSLDTIYNMQFVELIGFFIHQDTIAN